MTNSNPNPADERLRADLRSVLQRDPEALHNADHLQGLLADLAPDMPAALRKACVVAARSNAASLLGEHSEDQVVAWLRSQYPDVPPEAARQAVGAFAALSGGGRGAPIGAAVASPVFDEPTVAGNLSQPGAPPPVMQPPPGPAPVPPPAMDPRLQFPPTVTDRPPVMNQMTEMPQHPSLPPQQGGWAPPPPPPPPKSRKWLIVAVVAVLLIGGGVGAWFALKGGDSKLAAPKNVAAKLDGSSLVVTWQAVPNADHYVVTDTDGRLSDQTVTSATATFDSPSAPTEDHHFVVQAFTKDDKGGDKSQAEAWSGVLPGPKDVTLVAAGNDLDITWSAVPGAASYQVRDLDNSSFTQPAVTGTSLHVKNAFYTAHHFAVSAVQGGTAGLATVQAWTPEKALSAGEAALAYKMPAGMVEPGSCVSSYLTDSSKAYVSSVVSCSPANVSLSSGPKNLYAFQITDGDYKSFEDSHFGTGLPEKKGCDDSFPSSGTRWYWVNGNDQKQGDEFCWYNSTSGTNVFAWTYQTDNVAIQVEGSYPTTRTGLHDWWGTNLAYLN